MTLVQGPNGRLAVTDLGVGEPPCLFIHGLGARASFWADTLEHVAREHRAVAFDLRGHGASAMPADDRFSLEAFAADALAVADALGFGRFVLVGHSLGASAAVAAAAMAPERLAGLVLVDAAGEFAGAPPGALEQFAHALETDAYREVITDAFLANLDRANDRTRALVLRSLAETEQRVVAAAYRSLLAYHPRGALARFGGPVLLVVDSANESSFSLHAQAPQFHRRSVAGTSHWIMLDQPARFQAILDEFLATIPATTTDGPVRR